ncbi:GNAT family N-acetyltransferase [Kitasatospora sp. CB01950]|uniref:GNAT family N-acetyltransferase n=1 Tax=Kitasatospora sp. CB01950 TaxID=1703930 RepID=UPI00093C426D|nr:GNAT family N-acetyltransferase [Kitasatospora sp. CB01950]OKJ16082.1 acetyltransferase [Kitasatospora sp. CB01950]
MEPQVSDNIEQSRFEIRTDAGLAGFAEYQRRDGGQIAFVHTVIDPAFEGQGLGGKLARAALDTVRGRGEAVLPYCPFIRGWIAKHPEYVDLVPADKRAKFDL